MKLVVHEVKLELTEYRKLHHNAFSFHPPQTMRLPDLECWNADNQNCHYTNITLNIKTRQTSIASPNQFLVSIEISNEMNRAAIFEFPVSFTTI